MLEEIKLREIDQPVLVAGASLEQADAAMIMMHGRGASAQDILTNAAALDHTKFTYLAPQAPDHAWYPYPFTSPIADNEPRLSSSLNLISTLIQHLAYSGIPPERTILFGFSQGACLVMEYAVRHARRYGGVVGLSGGLIGPDGLQRNDRGSLDGSPILIGCSDVDPYIPDYRVQHTADVMRALGGSVTLRWYPNMGHTVNEDELGLVRKNMTSLLLARPSG